MVIRYLICHNLSTSLPSETGQVAEDNASFLDLSARNQILLPLYARVSV
jgi:hypothetical protein